MSVDPITTDATGYPSELDPMLEAIAQAITGAGGDLADFTAENVTVIPPEATGDDLDAMVKDTVARVSGLSLLVIGGGGANPDPEAPGPRMVVGFELQLYMHPELRASGAKKAFELVVALMKYLHDKQVEVAGFGWHEALQVLGFDPLPDPAFTAYSIAVEREIQF